MKWPSSTTASGREFTDLARVPLSMHMYRSCRQPTHRSQHDQSRNATSRSQKTYSRGDQEFSRVSGRKPLSRCYGSISHFCTPERNRTCTNDDQLMYDC